MLSPSTLLVPPVIVMLFAMETLPATVRSFPPPLPSAEARLITPPVRVYPPAPKLITRAAMPPAFTTTAPTPAPLNRASSLAAQVCPVQLAVPPVSQRVSTAPSHVLTAAGAGRTASSKAPARSGR